MTILSMYICRNMPYTYLELTLLATYDCPSRCHTYVSLVSHVSCFIYLYETWICFTAKQTSCLENQVLGLRVETVQWESLFFMSLQNMEVSWVLISAVYNWEIKVKWLKQFQTLQKCIFKLSIIRSKKSRSPVTFRWASTQEFPH